MPASTATILTFVLALGPVVAFSFATLVLVRRRQEIRRFERSHQARSLAKERGSHRARLLHPDIDLTQCIGCGSCVRACPEDGVLDLLHGQAVVVHGARCVGHGRCAEACPTGAIALTFGDISDRTDLPAINDEFEAIGVAGLYLAGEITGFSLVRNAVAHGAAVANSVARRRGGVSRLPGEATELLIVGAGPAGLSCALRAVELGLSYQLIDQAEDVGGTVAAYPRKKMVMTQPIDLPLHGTLPRLEYQKEDLVGLWNHLIVEHKISIRTGVRLLDVVREADGLLCAKTSVGDIRARQVCLCLGRRGTPRKLNVPGEGDPRVQYNLLDAESYQGRAIYVVGGGDSAAEAAVGLAERGRNRVTLCSRDADWSRVKSKNEARIAQAVREGRLQLRMSSDTVRIEPEAVVIRRQTERGPVEESIPAQDVFVFAGGDPPFDLLKRAGVSFDPSKVSASGSSVASTTALLWAVAGLLAAAVATGVWALVHRGYYSAEDGSRVLIAEHAWLRPAGKFGLGLGLAAVALFAWNLTYLARRHATLGRWMPGSLRFWMASHVFTGLASFLCVLVHAGFSYRITVGGFAFVSLGVVLVAGLIGRYFYAIVPHAANGRELDLDELRARLALLATAWDKSSRGLGGAVRERIERLIGKDRWRASLLGRIRELVLSRVRIHRMIRELRHDPGFQEVPAAERDELLALVRRSWRLSLQIAHYEELRAVLNSWRFFHRWLALLMVLFVVAHVVTALRYAVLDWPWSSGQAPARAEPTP